MSLDELFDKLEEINIDIVDREGAKQWLFEYACKVSEGYNLNPKTHGGFVQYCAEFKVQKLYDEGKELSKQPNWRGFSLDINQGFGGVKNIPFILEREDREASLPLVADYLDKLHENLGPIKDLYFKEEKRE